MLKDCLDHALTVKHDRKRVFCTGVLQEGSLTSLYIMNSPSDCFYVMYRVTNLLLPTVTKDMFSLINAVQGFIHCRHLLLTSIDVLSNMSHVNTTFKKMQ
ncbi:unnamed protein product [Mucor fragilis]